MFRPVLIKGTGFKKCVCSCGTVYHNTSNSIATIPVSLCAFNGSGVNKKEGGATIAKSSSHVVHNKRWFSLNSTNMASDKKISMAKRLQGTGGNVWVEFGKLATDYKAINLGQGFPDMHPPQYVKQALVDAVMSDNVFMNQYTRSYGHPRLVKALADTFSPMLDRQINANTEILVSVGAYGALFCAVQGLINPGDEAIIIEPYFDCYEPMVRAAGGIPVFIPLKQTKTGSDVSSADFKLDHDELASKFNEKTKLIFFNTPNNPLGKVFTRSEMMEIADLCKKHDVVVLADEVYEWILYPGSEHIKMATLPGMWDRTITMGSAGKTFGVTGWKVGWSIGPEHLLSAAQTMHQNCVYTVPTPIQEALAVGFETELKRITDPECYYKSLPAELLPKRDFLAALLRELGMEPIIPEGGYFMMADYSKLEKPYDCDSNEPEDYKFIKWMTREKGITAIPPSAFYSREHKHLGEKYVRFCFIKEDSTLQKAADILKKWKNDS